MAHPEYGAKYCRGAASEAVADTTMEYFIASVGKADMKSMKMYMCNQNNLQVHKLNEVSV